MHHVFKYPTQRFMEAMSGSQCVVVLDSRLFKFNTVCVTKSVPSYRRKFPGLADEYFGRVDYVNSIPASKKCVPYFLYCIAFQNLGVVEVCVEVGDM